MQSNKRFRGVAYNIASHSLSTLCWIEPLDNACAKAGLSCISIDLLHSKANPADFPIGQPLLRCLRSLREKLQLILRYEDLDLQDLNQAVLTFHYPTQKELYYLKVCHVKLEDLHENIYEDWVDMRGRVALAQHGTKGKQENLTLSETKEARKAPVLYVQEMPKKRGCLLLFV